MFNPPSVRAEVITRRTYNRPLDEGFETWTQTIRRVIEHQRWLWERAKGNPLDKHEAKELGELEQLLIERKVAMSGRTLWLGGTEVSKRREASQFNCAHLKIETIHDVVDALWLLLQGCGVGFSPRVGTLSGFTESIKEIEIVRSKRIDRGGDEFNREDFDISTGVWTISFGDSAEAWAKSIGKLLAGKNKVRKLVLDFSQLRPAGIRLSGYGWISSGDESISNAYRAIVDILNKRSGQLLTKIDILDMLNWLGTILSSRRSAEIALIDYGLTEWEEFARAKDNYFNDNPQRSQSNNSLVFWKKPTREQLEEVFQIITDCGGSEPGFINGEEALRRAPWFSGVNPCAEILLGNKSFCNLTELDVAKFIDDNGGMDRAIYLLARANYRQTLVNLDDGILQRTWHENNEYLRLCGVGLTGIVRRSDMSPYDFKRLRNLAVSGAYSMADELGLQRPKNVTTIKPSGTMSKIMDTTEGCHMPVAKYLLNNITFGTHDPLVSKLRDSGYSVFENPLDATSVVVSFPVSWEDIRFNNNRYNKELNFESAIDQLERYKKLMNSYVEQNCSITVSYDPSEIHLIIDWLLDNWDNYVGVSWMLRVDPSLTHLELGHPFLPQEAVTKKVFDEYVAKLKPVDMGGTDSFEEVGIEECSTGACPVK